MIKNVAIVAGLFVAMLFSTALLAQSDGGGYKNIPWYSSYEQVKYAISDLSNLRADNEYKCATSETVDREFYFIDNKLVKVHKSYGVRYDRIASDIKKLQDIREQLFEVLTQNYGSPSGVWGRTVGIQGIGFKSLLVLWNLPKGGIIMIFTENLEPNRITLNELDLNYLSPEEYEKKYNELFVKEQKSSKPYQRLDYDKVNVGL